MIFNTSKFQKIVLLFLDILVVLFTLYAIYSYTFTDILLQLILLLTLIVVKVNSNKIYDTVHIGFDIPLIFCNMYIFNENILSVPIIIYLLSTLIHRIINYYQYGRYIDIREITNFMVPFIFTTLFVKQIDIQNLVINFVIAVFIYAIINIYTLNLALRVYKEIKLFSIIDSRWLVIYFVIQSFFSVLVVQLYINYNLIGLYLGFALSVYVTKMLNKSISIEKHHSTYKETLEYFVEFYGYGIIILDKELDILSANDQFVITNELQSNRIVGMNIKEIQSKILFSDQVNEVLAKLKNFEKYSELTFTQKNRQYSLIGVSIGNEHEAQYTLLFKDITTKEQKNTEYITKKKLESIEELAAGTANDIKNPLTVALGFLQLLKLNVNQPKEKYYLEQAFNAISETDEYIELFALLGNPSKDHHKFEEFDLTAFLQRNIAEIFRDIADRVKAVTNIEKDVMIFGKKTLIKKLITSILENALEAIDYNGTIEISLTQLNGKIKLIVIDDGKGIDREDLIKVFDPYFTTRKSCSRGLGLYYCKRIVDQHNGNISLQSIKGYGTEVIIELNQ